MTFTTEITIDDHKDFQSFLGGGFAKRLGRQALFLLFRLIQLVILATILRAVVYLVITYVEIWQNDKLDMFLTDPNTVFWRVIGFLLIPIGIYWMRLLIGSIIQEPPYTKSTPIDVSDLRDGINLGRVQFETLPAGLNIAMPLDEALYHWSAFRDARETELNLFLMVDDNIGIILPKRAFANDQAVQEFKALFAKEVGLAA